MSAILKRVAWEVHWWTRWLVRYFPGLLIRRIRYCRKTHAGPMHDGWACLTCGAPWLGRTLP